MASENSSLGQLLKEYLFVVGKTETDLSAEIGLSRSKVSAAIHGKYRLKRDHVDSIVAAFAKWERPLTEEVSDALLKAWQSGAPALSEEQIIRAFLAQHTWRAANHAGFGRAWPTTYADMFADFDL